ncbi:MAG: flagellar hook-associated protein FlgK [Tepidimonas sp.]|uniref:flagellar hook-associated protein FlgK n=1 Tax=Tepidimonas sp. TaxID=2002775 RepID=UPI004054DA06
MSALNIATRALTTNQAVLQVIGHNIANANTAGYTRQRVELQSVPGQFLGGAYFGKGVIIDNVVREGYNAFLTREANSTASMAAADAVRYRYLQSVESLFPLGDGGLGKLLNDALNAWGDVASAPNDAAARQVVLDRFDALSARLRDTSTRLDDISQGARLQAIEEANTVNRLAQSIAELNSAITRVRSVNVGQPNDLLDQRERLIAQLNEKIQVSTLQADDGTVSVFVAGSQPLVLGGQAAELRVVRADLDGDRRVQLQFKQGDAVADVPQAFIGAGSLKGLFDFINSDITQTQAELGRVALAMGVVLNSQHQNGLDLQGTPGAALFSGLGPFSAVGATTNAGVATVTATVATPNDAAALQPYDYWLTFDSASTVKIQRASDGYYWSGSAWVPNAASAASVGSGVFEGLTLTLAGGTVGDRYALRPAATALANMQLAVSDPSALAAASNPSVGNVLFDGSNAQAMLALRDTLLFDGVIPLSDGYVAAFSQVASLVNQAKTASGFSQAQARDAEQRRANEAGVNLDEEAARLLQFQQAYQASAKYLQTIQSVFDTLISTLR